ncbi:MAG: cob(I)yrinic acid a,c-diamide adenosyltransferase [bacterium]|nr:cob(I)yrinic acid a,c-diamide adenosyltransferase [bacterium]
MKLKVKLQSFYTGKGDKGASLICGKKIDKSCCEVEALGELDELNSLLGIVRTKKMDQELKSVVLAIQENLFIIQANIAIFFFGKQVKAPVFKKEKVVELERFIDRCEKEVKPAKKFIIAGEHPVAAWFDYARAVSRRAERRIRVVAKKHTVNPSISAYMNRLSSTLFACGRLAAKRARAKELHPSYK